MISILFVCTGNQFRSPIAAAALRAQLREDGRAGTWTVGSAGTWARPGLPPLPKALEVARTLGLDLSGHVTRVVDAHLLEEADLVLVMEAGHKEALRVEFPFAKKKIYLLAEVMEGRVYDIPDPARVPAETFDILRKLVETVRAGSKRIYQIEKVKPSDLEEKNDGRGI